MLRKLAWVAACCCVLLGPPLHGLGLGEIKLSSALNQRFQATIPIISAEPGELENLKVRLAPNEAFARAGLERAAYLTSLELEVVSGGSPRIVVRSDQIAREPLMVLLVEASAGGTRVLREYSILLDPAVLPTGIAQPSGIAQPGGIVQPSGVGQPTYRQPEGIDPNAFVTPSNVPAAPGVRGPVVAPPYSAPDSGISTQPVQDYRPPQAPSSGARPGAYLGSYVGSSGASPLGGSSGSPGSPVIAASSQSALSGPPVVSYDRSPVAAPPRRTSADYYLTPQEIAALGAAPAYSESRRAVRPRSETPAEPRRETPLRTPVAAESEVIAPVGGETYGPVQPGDTLRKVARQMSGRFPGSSNAEIVQLLYVANPRAFAGGDINRLRRGATLKIPVSDGSAKPAAVESGETEIAAAETAVASPPVAEEAPPPPAAPVALAPPAATDATAPAPQTPTAAVTAQAPAAGTEPAPAPADPPATESGASIQETPAVEGEILEGEAAEPAPADETAADEEIIEIPGSTPAAPPVWIGLIEDAERSLEQYGVKVDSQGLARAGMWVALGLLALFALLALRAWRNDRAQREYKKAAKQDAKPAKKRKEENIKTAERPIFKDTTQRTAVSSRQELEALNQTLVGQGAKAPAVAITPARGKEPSLGDTGRLQSAELQTTGRVPTLDVKAPAAPGLAAAAKPTDLDVTAQFEANTLQIDLAADDPIAEADFNLAYGLYDEAALLLTQAAAKDPGRRELRVKLAETYFAGGKAAEFRKEAEALKPELPADEWLKLAILGNQLCPGDALFAEAESESGVATVDLSFDEPEAEAPQPLASRSAPPIMEPGLDFTLEDIDLQPPKAQAAPAAPAVALKSKADDFELDLGEFDLGPAVAAGDPARLSAAAAEVTRELDAQIFDLGDVETLDPKSATQQLTSTLQFGSAGQTSAPKTAALPEFDLSDIELDMETESDDISGGGDEVSTKLDLARAYVEMGDTEMAQGLLDEVIAQGSDPQRKEAQSLMERLAA